MEKFHLHLISDSTGGTLDSVVKACLAQFEGIAVEEHFRPLVRNQKQAAAALEAAEENPGLVLYTLVDDKLAHFIETESRRRGIKALSILHPVINLMSDYFGRRSLSEPGLQHKLDAEYFARMEAVDYALYHDDGQRTDNDLEKADVILVGVSRTSKTPTCIYLANRGVRAANIPFVPGVPLPEKLMQIEGTLIVALTASPARLVEIRKNRLAHLGETRETDYLDQEQVRDEIRSARRFYTEKKWPVIDVTRRSVEETAAEILSLLEACRAKGVA